MSACSKAKPGISSGMVAARVPVVSCRPYLTSTNTDEEVFNGTYRTEDQSDCHPLGIRGSLLLSKVDPVSL